MMSRGRREWALRGAMGAGLAAAVSLLAVGCSFSDIQPAPAHTPLAEEPYYEIGPGDVLDVFVWRSEQLSKKLTVRPDGRITFPLLGDLKAVGKTPEKLAREIQRNLEPFVLEPRVAVMVVEFSGTFAQQIRVIGEAQKPQAIPYRQNMSVLDVIIQVGGLTDFASGNRAVIARSADGQRQEYRVRLDDLVRDGDIGANVEMAPGDILIIPQRYL
jgi:polysaccharide export outer membrane protein